MICEAPVYRDTGMVRLPAGDFAMGQTGADKFANATERPAHRVRFLRDFHLGRFPVTVAEYRRFDSSHAPDEDGALPVVNVSWNDAQHYCEWFSRESGEPFRLATEAEWEYACRAHSDTPFSTGSDITTREANFFYSEEGQRIGPGRRVRVGAYEPNDFGLYDLHGNVCEWVEDAWHPHYDGAPCDGTPWHGNSDCRVIRGGAWDYLPRLLRSAWRDSLARSQHRDNVGFRLALTFPSI